MTKFSPLPGLKFYYDYMTSFSPGRNLKLREKLVRDRHLVSLKTLAELAKAHFSARAELLMRFHEVFLSFSPG